MVAAGLNWIAICYKSIREDVKWCTANGFIAVGDRKWWSTLSDSPTLPGLMVREGKFVRRSSALTYSRRKVMVTNYWKVSRQGHVLQEQKLLGREHLSIVCSRQLIKSRPLQRHRTKSPQRTKQPITRYWCALVQHTSWICQRRSSLPDLEAFPTMLPMNKISSGIANVVWSASRNSLQLL